MTLYIEPSETNSASLMPTIEGAVLSAGLEAITGADFMISQFGAPATSRELIQIHIQNGALLGQRKHGLDFVHSMGTRMNESLARMKMVGARSWQCILLYIGTLDCDHDGFAIVSGKTTKYKWTSVASAISKWQARGHVDNPGNIGGTFESIPRASLIAEWIAMKETQMQKFRDEPVKEVWPEPPVESLTDMQLLFPVGKGGKYLLGGIRGVGPKAAGLLYDEFDGDVAAAQCWLSIPGKKDRIKGIGPKTVENFREQLGIDPVMVMTLEVDEQLVEKEKERRNAEKV